MERALHQGSIVAMGGGTVAAGAQEIQFSVSGTSGKKYTVKIAELPKCSCPYVTTILLTTPYSLPYWHE